MGDICILESTFEPDFHRHKFTPFIEVIFDRMYDEKGAIWCEASVWARSDTVEKIVLPPARVNLMNPNRSGWKMISDTLSEYSNNDWHEAVRDVVAQSILAFRKGADPVMLQPSQGEPLDHDPFLINPFVSADRVTVLYAAGGVGKSLLALGAAISVASGHPILGRAPVETGPVVYVDYEDSPDAHQRRLDSLMRGHGVPELKYPILHKVLTSKASNAQSELRSLVRDADAKLVIVDSIGMARGGDLNSGEDTIRLFRTLNSLDVPVIAIDHVSSDDMKKSAENGTVVVKPIGSSYTYNSARLAWFVQRLPSSVDGKIYLQLTNTKASHSAKQDPVMAAIAWGDHVIDIEMRNTAWQELELTALEVIVNTLAAKGTYMSVKEISTVTGMNPDTVLRTISRHEDRVETMKAGGGRGVSKVVRLKGYADNN